MLDEEAIMTPFVRSNFFAASPYTIMGPVLFVFSDRIIVCLADKYEFSSGYGAGRVSDLVVATWIEGTNGNNYGCGDT